MISMTSSDFLFSFIEPVFLISIRLAILFMMTPLFSGISMPPTAKISLILGLSASLAFGLNNSHSSDQLSLKNLFPGVFYEFAIGIVLALTVQVAFAAFSMAAALLDVQIGFGIAQVLDPITHQQTPILTSMFNQIAVLMFLLADGHHALLRGVAYSLERFPPGRMMDLSTMLPEVIRQMGDVFGLGLALAAPVMFCILLVEISLSVISRSLPQINVFVVSIPLKVVIGLVALALWQAASGSVMNRIYASIYTGWTNLFQASAAGGN